MGKGNGGSGGGDLSWPQLIRLFWPQYLALFGIVVALAASETWDPYRHVLYPASDEELWKYSYPLRTNHVPAWAVPAVSLFAPLAAITASHLGGRISAVEAHHAALAAVTCVATTGLATNFVKVSVGRFRPNFVARCWPDGAAPRFSADGRPACADQAVDPAEGMKSFPSGHTSWSTSGLGFLSFWLMGKLRCFEGRGDGPLRLVAALLPFAGAAWIGASRLQDYWHHVEDVAAGFLLGLCMAWLFYRSAYAGVMSPLAGRLAAADCGGVAAGSGGPLSAGKRGSLQSGGSSADVAALSADDRV